MNSAHAAALKLVEQNKFNEALQSFAQARTDYLAVQNPALAAEMQNNIGVVYRAQKNYVQACAALEVALAEVRALADRRRTAQVLGNLGAVLLEMNELDRAAQALNESLELFDPQQDRQMRSEVMRVLGEVRLKQGNYLAGLTNYEYGLRTADKLNSQQTWLLKLLEKPLKMLGLK